MKLSVSMIVRNESSCLAKCLETVKDADEIVIIDTGSTDDTIDIAKRYTDKVYSGEEYKWIDDFSHSRNQSLSKCTGDWVLVIDADEELEPNGITKIREVINTTDKDAVYLKLLSMGNDDIVHDFIRLFKNNNKIKWQGRIHNYLNTTDGEHSDIKIRYGYSEAHKQDPDRALRILLKEVIENPSVNREKFYLAREYRYRRNWRLAIKHYDYYLETAIWAPEMAEAHLQKGRCYYMLGEYDKAKDSVLQAIKINADFKEAFIFMSELSGPKNQKKWLELSSLCKNNDVLFIRTQASKKEKGKEYYNNLYKEGYNTQRYNKIYEKIAETGDLNYLDMGCGVGSLSNYLKNYTGFDFSEKAIEQSKKNTTNSNAKFFKSDIYDIENYKAYAEKTDVFIATEVLEHLEKDIEIVRNIPVGKQFVFSVPSFDDPSHVRVFTESIVRERYKEYLDIQEVIRFNWNENHWCSSSEPTEDYILLVFSIRK